MRPQLLLALAVGLVASPAHGHDFWLQPQAFRFAPHAPTPLTLQVGHAEGRQRSPIRKARVVRFGAVGPTGALDLLADLHPGEPADDGRLVLQTPGQYVLALQTDDHAESHLPADRFNAHVEAEGLTLARLARRGREGEDGSERYSRVAKSLVQVGPPGGFSPASRPLGLPLEITLEADPYAPDRPAQLPVRVYDHGRPLAGALVKLIDLAHDAEPVEIHRTDADGRTGFQVPPRGAWLLTVVWARPLPATDEVGFETVFSSFSLGDR